MEQHKHIATIERLLIPAADSENVLLVEHLQVYAQHGGSRQVLVHDLSLSIRKGEMLAVVGESGSGKSVTASAILGLLPNPLHMGGGRIVLQGDEVHSGSIKQRRQLLGPRIGYVFQDYQGSFTPFIQVGKQLVEMLRTHRRLSRNEAKQIALQWLHEVGLPEERVFHSYPFQLSGGQRQRASLAAAMMLEPALLIADEPTTALDVLTGERVLDLLAKLMQQTGCAVLLISHDLRHVMKRADEIAIMKDGVIVERGPTETIRCRACHPYTEMLLRARPLLSEVHTRLTRQKGTSYEEANKATNEAIMEMTDKAFPKPSNQAFETVGRSRERDLASMKQIVIVRDLCKSYTESGSLVTAVHNVSLDINEGEWLGVVGESGSGKSTLTRLLLALERPDTGEIHLNGVSLLDFKARALREMRQHIQVVFQDPTSSLNQRLPIWRSLLEPLDNFPHVKPPFLADVRHSRRAAAAKLLTMVDLQPELIDRYPHELSGGQLQRVAIARGISLMPKLLICDEPTSSLDVSVQAHILQLLQTMKTRLGMAGLFVSHDMAAVRMMSDRIIVMKDGEIVDQFASEQMMSEDRHEYTKQLVAVVS